MDHMRANPDIWERAGPQTKPTQPSAAGASTRTSKAREPPPTPRTASQARRQEAAFGTRKSGYAPTSPMGDEPPVRNPHYNTAGGVGSRPAPAQAANPRPTSDFIDPLRAQFSETFLGDRRTPYAANVGEKTNPFEPLNVNRAKSMRDGSRKAPEDNTGEHRPPPPSRQRSASVDSEGLKRSPATETPGFTEPTPNPTFQFQSRASARYSPRAPPPETNSAPGTATFPDPYGSTSSVNSSANGESLDLGYSHPDLIN